MAEKKRSATSGGSKKKTLKIPVLVACAAAVLFAVCFFTYRFLFPAGDSSPSEVPAAELSAEEALINAINEAEASRSEAVKEYPVTVYVGDTELSALYSGTLYDGAPYGSGFYKFSGPDGAWSFSGTLQGGCISSGKVTDYPYVFDLEDENARSKYTGSLIGGLPRGDGSYQLIRGDDVTTLLGNFDAENKAFTGTAENYPLSFAYNGFLFEGSFTGTLNAGVPEGEGSFSASGEQYYSYSGLWSGGSPLGPGTLSTNCASFTTGDGASLAAVYAGGIENGLFSGTGEMTIGDSSTGGYFYSGGWQEGLFSGEGKLICYDPSGLGYTYEGTFSAGAYDGEGTLIFDNENVIRYIGHFEAGAFRPSVVDLVSALCSAGGSACELTQQVKEYILSHQEALLSHSTDGLDFGSGFSYDKYAAGSGNPNDRCFKTTVKLVQKTEYDASTFGFPVTELLGYASGGLYVYYGYYLGTLPEIASGDYVKVTGYPIGFSPYRDVSGSDISALRFVAFDVTE